MHTQMHLLDNTLEEGWEGGSCHPSQPMGAHCSGAGPTLCHPPFFFPFPSHAVGPSFSLPLVSLRLPLSLGPYLFQALSQSVSSYISYCLPLSCSLHLSISHFLQLLSFPLSPRFPLNLPVRDFRKHPPQVPALERGGGKRDMDPVPLRSAGTRKSGRTSVAANPAAPTLEAHFSESTTTAVLDQLHGCYSYRSAHRFSRDCRSPTTGPAQEPRSPGEGARWGTEGCNAGASAHVRRGHPLPHSPPLSVLGSPPDPLSSSKIPEPRCALSPGDAHPLWGPGSPCRAGARGGWM